MHIIFKDLTNEISSLGSATTYAFITIFFFLIGYITLAINLLIAFVIAISLVIGLRMIFFKDRPKKITYKDFLGRIAAASFPSQHSVNAALMFVILSLYFSNTLLTAFIFITSLTIAITRVLLYKHYWTDVIIGYVIGIIIGLFI